jgi:integrase
VRVSASGTKSFIVLYRQKGRLRRVTLGRYPVLSLAEARKLAFDALNRVAHGTDLQQEKNDQRHSYRFDDAVSSFVTTHCERRNRKSTATQAAATLANHFTSKWASRDVREIKRADVLAILDQMMRNKQPGAAIRSLAVIRKFFNWCVERGLIEQSPSAGMKSPAPHRSRDRVLDDDELAAIFKAARDIGYPFGAIVQLLILTAQRRNEVSDMTWKEIDFYKATWSIPSARSKNSRPQTVPLSSAALELITSLPQFGDPHLFPAQGGSGKAFSGFSKSKRILDKRANVSSWTLHDLRRTAATGMARLGVSPHVVERILNHTSGSLGGVAGIYNRFGYLPEMRGALDKWTAHVLDVSAAKDTAA